MIRGVPFGQWQPIDVEGSTPLAVQFRRAGHILGSAWVDCRCGVGSDVQNVIFSGDLGDADTRCCTRRINRKAATCWSWRAPTAIRNHEGRAARQQALEEVLPACTGRPRHRADPGVQYRSHPGTAVRTRGYPAPQSWRQRGLEAAVGRGRDRARFTNSRDIHRSVSRTAPVLGRRGEGASRHAGRHPPRFRTIDDDRQPR